MCLHHRWTILPRRSTGETIHSQRSALSTTRSFMALLTLAAEESHLDSGLKLERALYYSSFELHDKTEGMTAFKEKRTPVFKHR